jgi:hypothetical protein
MVQDCGAVARNACLRLVHRGNRRRTTVSQIVRAAFQAFRMA